MRFKKYKIFIRNEAIICGVPWAIGSSSIMNHLNHDGNIEIQEFLLFRRENFILNTEYSRDCQELRDTFGAIKYHLYIVLGKKD